MKIELTSRQYRDLMVTLGITEGILEVLSEGLPDEKGGIYVKQTDRLLELESYLLRYAKDMDCADIAETQGRELVLSDEVFEEEVTPILEHYNEYIIYDGMASELAWRDIEREYGKEEAKKIEEAGEKSADIIFQHEEKYWDEFDAHDFSRLEIQK
jgi:hypothetical protein